MGVPRLFPWLKRNFWSYISHYQQGEKINTVDALYIDANPLLHYATQFINNTTKPPRFIDLYSQLSEDEKMIKAFELFFDKIVDITKMIIPKKILYIAIDGPAPRAKQNQQRERRFVSAKLRLESEEKENKKIFNNTQLTPGTIFMHELTKYINYSIRKEMDNNETWKYLDVYFSPCSSPGEGEHKCLDFIRSLPDEIKIDYKHCNVGPDGDLIMLTMSAHVPNIFLFREDQYNIGYQDYLDMGKIIKELPRVLSQNRKIEDVVNDFIVEGFFVGNDFLPKIQMFHLLEDGLELMIKTYTKTSNRGTTNFLTIDGELSLNGFREFIKELTKYENTYLVNQVTTKDPKKQPPEEKFINKTLLNSIFKVAFASSMEGKDTLDLMKYRQGYYKKSFGDSSSTTTNTQENIDNMCRSYLRSFVWILKYYVKGLASWGWAYEYHYAPLMYDFNIFMNRLEEEEFRELCIFDLEEPSLPFEQLISVIPPASAYLLPKPFSKLLTSDDSPLVKKGYYPPLETLEIDYEGKLKDHEGIVHLNFVDYLEIHKEYERIANRVDMDKFHRNLKGKYPDRYPLYKFNYYPNLTGINYTNKYGTLRDIFIRKSLI